MAVFTVAKKRTDLSATERKTIKAIKELQRLIKKDWGVVKPCGDIQLGCSNCQHVILDGLLLSFLQDLEY